MARWLPEHETSPYLELLGKQRRTLSAAMYVLLAGAVVSGFGLWTSRPADGTLDSPTAAYFAGCVAILVVLANATLARMSVERERAKELQRLTELEFPPGE